MSPICRLFTLSSTVMHEEKTDDRIDSLFGSHNTTILKTPVPTSKIVKMHSLDSPQQQKYMLERKRQSNPQGRSSAHLCLCVCTRARSWNGYVWTVCWRYSVLRSLWRTNSLSWQDTRRLKWSNVMIIQRSKIVTFQDCFLLVIVFIEDDHVKEYKQHVFDNRMYIKKILNRNSNTHTFSLNRMYNSIINIISTVVTIFQHLLKNEKKKKQSFCFGSQKTKTFERTLGKQPSGWDIHHKHTIGDSQRLRNKHTPKSMKKLA
jgi:hypothetical protein